MASHDDPARPALQWAAALIDQLVYDGVTDFFVAPGSRSTPLTVAAALHPEARVTVHFDERGTAFMALGAARATGRPAAWITTSGTAVANGLPAVVEANVDHVPLLLLTADRPPELRFTGANQTIDQVKIFGDQVRWFFDFPVPEERIGLDFVRSTAAHAVAMSLAPEAGPVHLNCMFREPLIPDSDVGRLYPAGGTRFRSTQGVVSPPPEAIEQVRALIDGAERGLIVAGRMPRSDSARAVAALARRIGWPMMVDVQSQLRFGNVDAGRIAFADAILGADNAAQLEAPDVVLHFGGGLVSKRISRWLTGADVWKRVVIRGAASRLDPFHQFGLRITCNPCTFARELAAEVGEKPETTYARTWQALDAHAAERLADEFEATSSLTEPLVARIITEQIPDEHLFMIGSSMPIRDVDTFGAPAASPRSVLANRGASGIDGTIATAVGASVSSGFPATVLCGDLTLLHDLNSLAATRTGRPFVVVVINNDGGGIFSFLPIARHEPVFERFFGTPHGFTFEHAAQMFGLAYASPSNASDLAHAYREASEAPHPTLIEVRTDREANRDEHRRLLDALGQ